MVVPSSTIRPSTWKNSEPCDASIASYRKQRPGRSARIGGLTLCITRIWPGDVCVRRRWPVDVDVQRVPQVARRMVGRDVEHLEVGEVVLDLRALVHDEPELAEDLGDLGASSR